MNKYEVSGKILSDLLSKFWCYDDIVIEKMLQIPGMEIKQNVARVDDLQVIIYSNDHDPPHFHVTSRDKKVDAKFRIDDGSLFKGEMKSKDLKKIKVFYNNPRTKLILEKIWNKRSD